MNRLQFLLFVTWVGLLAVSCQPQTKRDRAGVGPATETPTAQPTRGDSANPSASTGWTLSSENWEENLK